MSSGPLLFSFPIYVDSLKEIIRTSRARVPVVIGITGPWGSGKSTLMENIGADLSKEGFLPVRFNAWAYSKQEVVWRALFSAILEALRRALSARFPKGNIETGEQIASEFAARLDQAERALYSSFDEKLPGNIQLDAGKLAKSGVKLGLRLLPAGEIWGDVAQWLLRRSRDRKSEGGGEDHGNGLQEKDVEELWGVLRRSTIRRHVARIESLEQFRSSMVTLLSMPPMDEIKIIVTIDDVDRCLPEQSLEVFEAIRLFLDLPRSVFLIAMDQDLLQRALDLRYRQEQGTFGRITAELYSEKMLDLTFAIPSPDEETFKAFVRTLPAEALLLRHYAFLSRVLPLVPRTWDRFSRRTALNYEILSRVMQCQCCDIACDSTFERLFIKIQALSFIWPRLVRSCGTADVINALERCIRTATADRGAFETAIGGGRTIVEAIRERSNDYRRVPAKVWPLVEDRSVIECLAAEPYFSETDEALPALKIMLSMDLAGIRASK